MMEQLHEDTPDLSHVTETSSGSGAAKSTGQLLREARERQGLSVDDVVSKIKLAARQIVAMEADDFKALPETAFLRGFVRSYAKLLQIDAQPLLDALPGAEVTSPAADLLHVETPFPERSVRQQNVNLLVAAFLLVLVIAGFVIWQGSSSQPAVEVPATVVEAAQVTTPLTLPDQIELLDGSGVPVTGEPVALLASQVVSAAVVEPVVENSPVVSSTLRVEFDKASWTEIKEQSGRILSKQVNPGGSELRVEGQAPFMLIIGHAASARLYYKDKAVDLAPYIKPGSDVARLTLE